VDNSVDLWMNGSGQVVFEAGHLWMVYVATGDAPVGDLWTAVDRSWAAPGGPQQLALARRVVPTASTGIDAG
jgi:hypothetical protein